LTRRRLPWRGLPCRRRLLLGARIRRLLRCWRSRGLLRVLASRRAARRLRRRWGRACCSRLLGRAFPGSIRSGSTRCRSTRGRSTGSRHRTRARRCRGLRCFSPAQPRRPIAVAVVQPYRYVLRFVGSLRHLGSIRQVRPRGHPHIRAARILAVQRSTNRKQSLRISRLLNLIDRARVQRHRHRVSLIRARIVKLAIHQNCDRD
jgi:hypothetical protein